LTLRAIYRSTASENGKPRPPFFSKLLSLASFLRAVEELGQPVDILFLNDGGIPPDRLRVMEAAGEVGWLPQTDLHRRLLYRDQTGPGGGGMARSYLGSMAAVERKGWPDEDVVYLVEDDYLHAPDALRCLLDGAAAIPEASYIALYATIDWARTRTLPVHSDGYGWHTAISTTSTFAARVGALRIDRWIHRLGYFGCLDPGQDIGYAYQGIRSYPWSTLLGSVFGRGAYGSGSVLGRSKRAAVQGLMNALAIKSSFAPHLLVAPVPAAATHLHFPYLAPGVDWERIAEETFVWARERGIPVTPAQQPRRRSPRRSRDSSYPARPAPGTGR
jgi:hypothetical protein